MAITELDWDAFVIHKALCPDCQKFSLKEMAHCKYWSIPNAERGIAAVGAEAVKTNSKFNDEYQGKKNYLYKVIECPDFIKEGETNGGTASTTKRRAKR